MYQITISRSQSWWAVWKRIGRRWAARAVTGTGSGHMNGRSTALAPNLNLTRKITSKPVSSSRKRPTFFKPLKKLVTNLVHLCSIIYFLTKLNYVQRSSKRTNVKCKRWGFEFCRNKTRWWTIQLGEHCAGYKRGCWAYPRDWVQQRLSW